jgi:hypothetical protein
MMPDDATLRSIRLQGVDDDESRHFLAVVYRCGCWLKGDKWSLCQYHVGFDDGVEAAVTKGAS